MAKLYAEVDSDKHGRKAGKGGDSFLRIAIVRGNKTLGTLGVYEVEAGTNTPAGVRVVWHDDTKPYPRSAHTIIDTTEHALRIISLHDAQAECTGCGWYYAFTGERTRAEIEAEHKKAHSTA